jgi:vesicle coat complex subunit
MIPILVQHFSHPSPKVRHAAAHAVHLVDDMPMDYQNRYFEMVIPALISLLDDPVPRVAANATAALTNFFEHATSEMVNPVALMILTKIYGMI